MQNASLSRTMPNSWVCQRMKLPVRRARWEHSSAATDTGSIM
ncbi:Uncharacterised protein [Bordetella pertussis]|nr:Uncharacterised protein [Bordetella pertussis]